MVFKALKLKECFQFVKGIIHSSLMEKWENYPLALILEKYPLKFIKIKNNDKG